MEQWRYYGCRFGNTVVGYDLHGDGDEPVRLYGYLKCDRYDP